MLTQDARKHNFNSRPHGGRLGIFLWGGNMTDISTHALTEGDFRSGDVFEG